MRKFLLSLFSLVAFTAMLNATEVTYVFSEHPDFEKWGSSYKTDTLDYTEAYVVFNSASKQSQTITDALVTKIGNAVLILKDGYSNIKSVTFNLKKWAAKSKTALLAYSTDGGNTFTETDDSALSSTAEFSITNQVEFPASVNAVKLFFSATNSSNQVGIYSVTFSYGDESGVFTPAAPTFSVKGGTYSEAQDVVMNCSNATADTQILFTTDGTDPKTSDSATMVDPGTTLYITESCTLRAVATDDLENFSSETKAVYNIVSLTGDGSKENPFTVADVVTLNNTLDSSVKYWVKGVVAGVVQSTTTATQINVKFDEFTNSDVSNIALASSEEAPMAEGDGELTAQYVPVKLDYNTDARSSLNLYDNPTNLGKTALVYGTLELYFSHAGMKNTTDFEIDGSSAISNVNNASTVVLGGKGCIDVVAANSNIVVYNASGAVISKGANHILCPAGLYIVNVNNKATKVIVK